MFPEMPQKRILTTDEILVELTGDFRVVLVGLSRLARGYSFSYPPAGDPWWDGSEAFEEYRELVSRLNNQAPEGYYFGGHPDQIQCLGYWPK